MIKRGSFAPDDDIDELVQHFRDITALFSSKHHRHHHHGLQPPRKWMWRLFLGQDDAIEHEGITALLSNAEEMKSCQRRREDYRRQFLGEETSRFLYLPHGVQWRVCADVPMPFIVPYDLVWFNPKSVLPDRATRSEMRQNGRIVDANAALHKRYAALLRHLIAIEPYVIPSSLLFSDWHTPELFHWHKPLYSIVIEHDHKLGWSMFLAISKSAVGEVLVPSGAVISYFAGEIKALDVYEPEHYAFTYIQKHYEDETYLVCTKAETEMRPGICSMAFFSNHTCMQEPWFVAVNNRLMPFKKQEDGSYVEGCVGARSGVVWGATELYRHRTLVAAKDITARMVRALPSASETHYKVPVEWDYYPQETPQPSASFCTCLSHCRFSAQPSFSPFSDPPTKQREKPQTAAAEDPYILKYLSQFEAHK